MATKIANIVLTANAQQPEKLIETLHRQAEKLNEQLKSDVIQLETLAKTVGKDSEAYKKLAQNIEDTRMQMQMYQSVKKADIEKTKQLADVINDLANARTRDIKAAVGKGSREAASLTGSPEDLARAKQLREQQKMAMDELRKRSGEYVNMTQTMRELNTVSDETLSKAIKQQQQVVSSTKQVGAEYQNELNILKQLQAEEARRKMPMSVSQASQMATSGTLDGKAVSSNQIKEAQKVLGDYKGTLTDPAQVKAVDEQIERLQQQFNKLNGVVEKTTKISGDAARNVREVLRNPSAASPESAQKALDALQARLRQLPADSKGAQVVKRRIEEIKGAINGTRLSQEEYNKVLANPRTASVEQLKKAYAMLQQQIERTSRDGSSNFNQLQQQAKRLKAEIDSTTISVQKQDSWFRNAIRNIGAYMGVFAAFNAIKNKITEVITLNKEFSDQLVDIRKVSNMAIQDVNTLARQLAKIDTRSSVQELNKLAYAGAKLGMGKYGVAGLEGFVNAANQVNVALKEDLGDDALTALSKMTEVMGLIPKYGVEKSMLATGSAMFKLASTSTATAADIVEFSKRLTGMARTAGITTDQLLALGSASSSMMLMPEVSSTAFNKVITAIQRNSQGIEKSLNIDKGTIANMLEAGDAMQALVLILEKMKEKGNMSALGGVFKDLGSDSGARLTNVMVTMAKNVDMLKEHLKTSKIAFEEASAVTKEYNMQQETAAGIMERANNMWMKAFINPEGVDNVKALAQEWYNLSKALTESATWMWSLKAIINSLLGAMKLVLMVLPQMVFWIGAMGLVGAASSAIVAIRQLGGVLTALHYGVLVLHKAFMALSVVGKMTWIGAAIGLITGLISYFISARKEAQQFANTMDDLRKAYQKTRGEIFAQQQALKDYEKAINRAKKGTKERAALIKGFNEAYGQYLSKLLTEKSTMQDLASAITEVNKQLEQKSMLEAKQEWKKKNVTTRYVQAGEKLEAFGQAVGGTVQNRTANMTWLRELVENNPGSFERIQEAIRNRFAYEKWNNKGTEEERKAMKERNSSVYAKRLAANEYARQQLAAIHYNQKADQIFGADPKLKIDKEGTGPIVNDNVEGDINRAADDARKLFEELLAKIKNYYTRQTTAFIEQATADNIEKPVQDAIVKAIEKRKNDALAAVQQSFVRGYDDWKNFVPTMAKDLREPDDDFGQSLSKLLLDEIQDIDLMKIRKDLLKAKARIKKGKIVGYMSDESDIAYLDRISLRASGNENKNARIDQRQAEMRRKEIMERNYTGTVQQQSYEGLYNIGLVSPDLTDAKAYEKDKQRVIDMLENARANIVEIMEKGPSDNQKSDIMEMLFGADFYTKLKGSAFEPLLKALDKDWQLFYDKLMQYSDDYTEAEKKQADRRKKVNDYLWQQTATYKTRTAQTDETQATIDSNKLLPNKGRKWTQANGFRNNLDDPEIRLLQIKMQLEAEHLQFLMKHNATEEQLAEQWRNAADAANEYSQRIMESISERMEMMEQWTDPLVTFGGAMGEAFAKMEDDAEEGAQAVQDALRDMLRSWGEITIRIIAERMAQSMQQSFYNQMEESEEEKHQEKMSDIRTSGGKKGRNTAISVAKSILNAKMQWNKKEQKQDDQSQKAITDSRADAADQMVGIEKQAGAAMLNASIQTGATLLATKKAQDQAEIQENAGKTEANVTMSLADALGKCFAQLGPVGGAIAAAGVQALLMALLNWALSKAFSSKSTSASSAPKVNTKLVSGMLTYDQGNLKQMYLGNDGKLYAAKSEEQLPTGIVTQPVATTINGQPSLVGERGPELVVGRETTAAMMQNAPQLLQALLDYDKNRRLGVLPAYDRGNIGTVEADTPTLSAPQPALTEELLTQLLYYLQHPVAPNINMYGREGLHEKMKQADRFMRGK